ncbi:phosphotransferase family protein [Actinoplanes sp. HUAS TT8]|uniref:phosphotransferase family protein n=1 Tax=Actinoplanes sp. HUAS TT8 TaxID=3447453 RepID=UPI003F522008
MDDWLAGVQALIPGSHVEFVDQLGGSTRSNVRRIRAGDRTLIVKEFTGPGDGWVRECAALFLLPPQVPAPHLVATGVTPPTVVMSDLGSGRSVADLLLGPDRAAAVTAVTAWARAVGTLHGNTAGLREDFRQALSARSGDRPVSESRLAASLDEACAAIARQGPELGVTVAPEALDELRGIGARLGEDGPAALTPSDACPDNNVFTGDALALIDFEGAQWRHIAWDVAYLTVPWPSCWCSWRLPDDVADQAIEAYRSACALPYVDTAAFRDDVRVAAIGWAVESMSWLLPRALADESPLTRPMPTRRAMILHRLGRAADSTELPALAGLAADFRDALTDRWGEVRLPYAPAFRATTG